LLELLWFSVPADESSSSSPKPTLIARSKIAMAWVNVAGHGKVAMVPWPDYAYAYYTIMCKEVLPAGWIASHRNSLVDVVRDTLRAHPLEQSLGTPAALLVCVGGGLGLELCTARFMTSQEDSNLVANVYYANYISWQARTRDNYFQAICPELFRRDTSMELFCTSYAISHKSEAMPYDIIEVVMHLTALREKGLELLFYYYRVLDDVRTDQLLATCEHKCVFTKQTESGSVSPCAIPSKLVKAFLTS
jgi:acyl-CoA thioesterase FadM